MTNTSLKLTTTLVKSRLKKISPAIKVLGKYIGSREPLRCKCLQCGKTWFPNWNNLKQGRGCPKCSNKLCGNNRLTLVEIKGRLRSINPTLEILSKEYQNEYQKIKCVCHKCNTLWYPIWINLSKGHGCPKCGQNRTNNKLSLQLRFTLPAVKGKLSQINSNIKIIGQYNGAFSPLNCICLKCRNTWSPTWSSLKNGSGCPRCWSSKFERETRDILERLTGEKFPRCRPSFLKGLGKQPLELDCYNEKLKLGVECQDESHYKPHWSQRGKRTAKVSLLERMRRDWRKQKACSRHGVKLIRINYRIKNIENYLKNRIPDLG